jgi:hypothetical protein
MIGDGGTRTPAYVSPHNGLANSASPLSASDHFRLADEPGFGQSDRPDAQCRVIPVTEKGQVRLDSLRSAMTGTLQHAQIGPPRTNCITILVGHYPG